MTTIEKELFNLLLDSEFAGKDELKEQLENCQVESIDENGSLKIYVKNNKRANVKRRIPIEAEGEDSDGITIHVLLHVVNGFADELEIYKDDSSKVIQTPNASGLRLICLD